MDEIGFVVREAKKVLSLQMLGDHGRDKLFNFFNNCFCKRYYITGIGREGQKRRKKYQHFIFWTYNKIKSGHIFFGV